MNKPKSVEDVLLNFEKDVTIAKLDSDITDTQMVKILIASRTEAQQQLYKLLVSEAVDLPNITYDFGTALEVGKVKAVPLDKINKLFNQTNGGNTE